LLLAAFLSFSSVSWAQDGALSPADLVSLGPEAGGRGVRIRGEAVGEALRADARHVWVNLHGEGAGVGVYVERRLAARIRKFGDYRQTGDLVLAEGTFNYACPFHGGELDVHATDLVVEAEGRARKQEPRAWKAIAGVAGLGVFFYALRTYLRRLKTKGF